MSHRGIFGKPHPSLSSNTNLSLGFHSPVSRRGLSNTNQRLSRRLLLRRSITTFPHQYSAAGALLTTTSHCDFRSPAYLQVYPFGPRFLLFPF